MGQEKYTIDIFMLSNGRHEFHFEFDSKLFGEYKESPVAVGDGKVNVVLNKSETMMALEFEIVGRIELICDRSMDVFWLPLRLHYKQMFRFGKEWKELSDDISIILQNTQRLHLAQYIYEFICLAIPMKKLHPRFDNNDEIESEVVYSSANQTDSQNYETDPRWNELKKIKR